MIRLSTQTTQTIKFIPKQGVVERLVIENEATSEQVELDLLEVVNVLGEELVVNGGFDTDSDWDLKGAWTISDGKLIADENTNEYATQGGIFESGKNYKVTVNISEYVSGILRLLFGATFQGLDVEIASDGEFVFYINNMDTSTNDVLYFMHQYNFIGSIDSVSVKEESQDTEIHYTTLDNHTELEMNLPEGFLQEGGSYILKALDSASNVLFYDKVFVTDQTDYTINKDEFKSYSQSETYKTFKG